MFNSAELADQQKNDWLEKIKKRISKQTHDKKSVEIFRMMKDSDSHFSHLVFEELANHKDFEQSNTEVGTYESVEKLKYPQEYEDAGINILDDFNEKVRNDILKQAVFKRSTHNNVSDFLISQDNYELPTQIFRANARIFHVVKPSNLGDVQNQNKASVDMTINELKYLTGTCCDQQNQQLTIDTTEKT